MRTLLLSTLLIGLSAFACTGEKTTSCVTDSDCPANTTCSTSEGVCIRETVIDATSTDTGQPNDVTTTEDATSETDATTTTTGEDAVEDTAEDTAGLCGEETCDFEETCCDVAGVLTCIDLNRDTANCGVCGNACANERRCVDASCQCPAALDDCDGNGSCETNILANDTDCGACGNACGTGQACVNGGCICGSESCAPGESCCGSTYCADLTSDTQNCGACGTTCALNQACVDGACTCADGFADCNQNPADGCEQGIADNMSNCGACGNSCFSQGLRDPECCNGTCVDTSEDSLNCGDCSLICISTCNSGRCNCNGDNTNLRSDDRNCGSCGNDCEAGPNVRRGDCREGVCDIDCRGSWEDCDPVEPGCETNLDEDSKNCGACGTVCPSQPGTQDNGSTCNNGRCEIACFDGFGDCDNDATNSCETELNTVTHCGACGRECAPGAECVNGDCVCPGAGGEQCRKTGTRYSFAGCDGTNCILTCTSNIYGDCDGLSTNGCEALFNTSEVHCGRCNNACPVGQTCTTGTCAL